MLIVRYPKPKESAMDVVFWSKLCYKVKGGPEKLNRNQKLLRICRDGRGQWWKRTARNFAVPARRDSVRTWKTYAIFTDWLGYGRIEWYVFESLTTKDSANAFRKVLFRPADMRYLVMNHWKRSLHTNWYSLSVHFGRFRLVAGNVDN